jgi:glycerol-3-phosphate dehydrogenase
MVPVVKSCHWITLIADRIDGCHSYTGGDPIGVELAGALKNVFAIAAGTAEGMGFENNARAGKYDSTIDYTGNVRQ